MADGKAYGRLLAAAVVAAALALALLSERMASVMVSERRSIVATASNKLLYDSEFVARSLDRLLRLADSAIEAVSHDFAAAGPRSAAAAAVDAATRVPESQNVYVLDGTGAVAASAWHRTSPTLGLPEGVLRRLALTGKPETLVASAPAEGGGCLATVSALPWPERYIAILFTASALEGRTRLLKERGEEAAEVSDVYSGFLSGASGLSSWSDAPRPAAGQGVIASETAMAYHPLKVRIARDMGPSLADWRTRLVRESSMVLFLLLASAILLSFALSARRRAAGSKALEEELRSKELLFLEVNHRVKNNLTVVRSILTLGEMQVASDPDTASQALVAASERIGSIAMLHELLYKSRSADEVELGPYFSALASELSKTYLEGRGVEIEVDVAPGTSIGLKSAVPLALVVTELATNACKYAFPDGRQGKIVLSAEASGGGSLLVGVEDGGAWDGSPAEASGSGGFGLELVDSLVHQLGARLTRSVSPGGHGMSCRIEVPIAEGDKAPAR